MLQLASLAPLLGLPPSALDAALAALFPDVPSPEVKTYPDATYRNYYTLALSVCLVHDAVESIDIFNAPSSPSPKSSGPKPAYSPPPPLGLHFSTPYLLLPNPKTPGETVRVPRPEHLEITPTTPGKEIVRRLGEPKRKGSGSWLGVWLEWPDVALRDEQGEEVSLGIMLELKDPKSAGSGGVWDRAADWPWSSVKVFRPEKRK